jgi:malonyl CoA-acyl carrier protein transacylase
MSATAILKLSQADFAEAQVEALGEFFDSQMATKADIARLEAEMATKADIAEVRLEIERVRSELVKWVAGLMIVHAAAVVASIKLLPGAPF